MRSRKALWILAALSLALCALAQQRPDFSGEYLLNKAKSELQSRSETLERGGVTIVQKGDAFSFTQVLTSKGKADRLCYQLVIGAKETAGQEGAMTKLTRLYWDDGVLVYQARYVRGKGGWTIVTRYTLEEGGKVLRAEEKFRGPKQSYTNVWIYERKPAEIR